MKFTKPLLILCFLFNIIHTTSAQTSILSKQVEITKKRTIGYELINYLQNKTNHSINYSESLVKVAKDIKLAPGTYSVKFLLDKIFANQQVDYIVKTGKILVKPRIPKSSKNERQNQHFINLKGEITETQTGEPIGFASISVKGQTIGTVSNSEGEFVFHIPVKFKEDSLLISCIGYQMYKAKVANCIEKHLDIKLTKKIYDLSEVAVKPKDALEIVKQAIAKIPENYPTQPINMDGFYREMTFENDTCVELAEAACEFYYQPYNDFILTDSTAKYIVSLEKINENHYDYFIRNVHLLLYYHPKDRLKIIEARASKLFHKHRFRVVPRGGPMRCVAFDFAKNRNNQLLSRYFKKFDYSFDGITTLNNKEVYIINYKNNRKIGKYLHKGVIYIDTESLAFVSIRITDIRDNGAKNERYWTPALYKKRKKRCKDLEKINGDYVQADYQEIGGKWYLKYVKVNEKFDFIFSKHYINKDKEPSISYQTVQELVINKIETKNIDSTFDESFVNSLNNVIYDYDLNYNESFWENYNIIKTTPYQDSIINQLEIETPLEKQFKEKLVFNDTLCPPHAKEIEHQNPFTKLNDEYYWMNNLKDPAVFAYVKAENRYTTNYTLPLKKLRRQLYFEMLSNKPNNKVQVDFKLKNNQYTYYYKDGELGGYENIYRKQERPNTKEELVLDIQKLAKGRISYGIGHFSVDKANRIIAYEEYESGGYENKVVFKKISTGEVLDTLVNARNITWSLNNDQVYYLSWDSTNRVNRLLKHSIGNKQDKDKLVYFEEDPLCRLSAPIAKNGDFLLLESTNDYYYNEYFLLNLKENNDTLTQILERKEKNTSTIALSKDSLFCLLKNENKEHALYSSSILEAHQRHWKKLCVLPKIDAAYGPILTKDYMAVLIQEKMQQKVMFFNKPGLFVNTLEFNHDKQLVISVLNDNARSSENKLKINVSSLKTPGTTYIYDIVRNNKSPVSKLKIANYSQKKYVLKRLWATQKDGTSIPITVFYNKKKAKRNAKSPVLLEAYGSFGSEPYRGFKPNILPLVDRGVIYAIAHVRGGGELGDDWHEQGMQLCKKNTFTDFITCAEFLIQEKYTSKGKIAAKGGSAGGLVMGAVSNMRPDLFNTVVLNAPFLDVLNSVTDPSAKFSTEDWGEYGNPNNSGIYGYIKSYSPYQNIKKQDYPNMLFTIGLNDTKVEYWQGLKAVAKLRKLKTDKKKLFLKADLFAGHSGKINPNARLIDDAFIYAFILDNLGIKY